jgi:glutamate/aspartate transport system substrate-binding protein
MPRLSSLGLPDAFTTMARQRVLTSAYHQWFVRPAPTGEVINLPISLQLTEAWRALGLDAF